MFLRDLMRVTKLQGALRILAADAISKAGDWILFVAMSVVLYRAGGAAALALFNLIRIALPIALGPWAGRWGARLAPRHTMILADLGRAILLGAAAVVAYADIGSSTVLFALVLGCTALATWYTPAERRFQRDAVPLEQRPDFNAVIGATGSTVMIVAPALGGALLAFFGPATALAVNAASFAVSILIIASIRLSPAASITSAADASRVDAATASATPVTDTPPAPTGGAMATALRVPRRDGFLRASMIIQTAACTIAGATLVMFAPIADRVGASDAAVGWLATSIGIGSVIGVVLGGRIARRKQLFLGGVSIVAMGVVVGLMGSAPNLVAAMGLAVVSGILANLPEPLYWTSYAERVPESMSGPFYGLVESLIAGAFASGGMLLGAAATLWGIGPASWAVGAVFGLVALGALRTARVWESRPSVLHDAPQAVAAQV